MSVRTVLPAPLADSGIVAVLRAADAADYLPVCRALVEEGITALELTLTTPRTLERLPLLRAELPTAQVGVGTIRTVADAHGVIAAGADFAVTPTTVPAVLDALVAAGLPVVAGAFTPTEVDAAWHAGVAAVKLFPAATVGPDYLRQLAGPFPGLPIVPSGGVDLADIPAWIRAGSVAVSLGGPLVGDALRGGDLDALRERARTARAAVDAARSAA